MTTSHLLSKHLQQFITGPNLTGSHLSQHLDDVSIKEANISLYGVNSIAQLVFHIDYYISAVGDVLEGKPLLAKDSLSFDAPVITTETAWQSQKRTALYINTSLCSTSKKFSSRKIKGRICIKKIWE